MTSRLFLHPNGTLKHKSARYRRVIADLRESVGERAAVQGPAQAGSRRSEVRLARPLTNAFEPWWVR